MKPILTGDEIYMHRCLQLAVLAAGNVAPNPMVGAVLVFNNNIIGEGYHKIYGQAHAEVNCIRSVSDENVGLIEKSTLYVSLEPCAHHGKTPPCADLIIKSKIPRVVIGCPDIFKDVNGQGIQKLRDAGIDVVTGILQKDCLDCNKRFFTFHQKKRPYIILKWAESLNGKIGASENLPDPARILISNEYTNRLVHKWRSQEAAIMVGTNTALYDDPSLTTRLWTRTNTIRLVIDTNLRLPHHLTIFNKEVKTIIFNTAKMEQDGNTFFYNPGAANGLPEIMTALYNINVHSVLIEGGSMLLQSFINNGLWDEARVIINRQLIIENGLSSPQLSLFSLQKQEKYSNDTICYFTPSVDSFK